MFVLRKLCVLCFRNNVKLKNIYSKDSNNVLVLEKLEYAVALLDKDLHGLPMYICEECNNKVNNMYLYKQQCLKNLSYISTLIRQLNSPNNNNVFLSAILDKTSTEKSLTDGSVVINSCNEIKIEQNIQNNTKEIKNTIKSKHLSERIELQTKLEENTTDIKTEDIDTDYELFENQIINNDIKSETKTNLDNLNENILIANNSNNNRHWKICEIKVENNFEVFEQQKNDNSLIINTFSKKSSSCNKKRLFKCSICKKIFEKRYKLTEHMNHHIEGKLFKCNVCFKTFKRKDYLVTHLKIHTEDRPFKCDVCLNGFKRRQHLLTHLRTHDEEKPFKCEECLRAFNRKDILMRHSKIHTGLELYQCDFCAKGFTRRSNLTAHLRIHSTE